MVEEVLKVVPDATVEAKDLHGSGDHFHVRVISKSYEEFVHYRDSDLFLATSSPSSRKTPYTPWI